MTRTLAEKRPVRYCIVPRHLADELHDALRDFYRDDPSVQVIVEQRRRDRRAGADRRQAKDAVPGEDRRRVRAHTGRRVDQRRASLVAIEAPGLPEFVREHAEELEFVERLEPSTVALEDADTARLVARLQAGERGLFNHLYLRYFDRVYAYLRLTLQDTHEAEDAAQDVFIRILEALPGYERREVPFRAWLFRIVRNTAINRIRQRQRLTVEAPEEMANRGEERDAATSPDSLDWLGDQQLMALIEQLPLAQRQVIVLRYMLELRAVEIATVLDRSPQAIRQLHHRAMRFLRQRLGETRKDGEEEGWGERRVGPKTMTRLVRQSPVLTARRFASA
jgi:RNA polymerase sigma-70 factor (ECF subfamily)